MRGIRGAALAAVVVSLVSASAQEPQEPQPRFRAGANLVRVDAYITANGTPVSDLRPEEVEILEDGVPQRIESFELIRPRPPVPQQQRVEPDTVAESRRMAAEADARVFVLFLDYPHVQLAGSFRARAPITRMLDQVIGQDDLVGVMTPEMPASQLALARRTTTIEGMLEKHWFWGVRDQRYRDERETVLARCYMHLGSAGEAMAEEVTSRRLERKTLEALEDLVYHLEAVREERKFVVLLSEGWILHPRDERLARPVPPPGGREPIPPGLPDPIMIGPGGLTFGDPNSPEGDTYQSCERERTLAAQFDHRLEFLRIVQRANRANVSFYPVDARGLVVFDEPIGPRRPPTPAVDAARLGRRQDALRELAINTDGFAILNTNDLDTPLARLVADTSSYYLMGYYSTNTRLDGRYRRISVRVTRPGAQVRARPGYLAPTEAELAAAMAEAAAPPRPAGAEDVAEAFARLASATVNVPLRATASASGRLLWLTVELDAATAREPEWKQGGRLRVAIEADYMTEPHVAETGVQPGTRHVLLALPDGIALDSGRHTVRVQLTPNDGRLPVQVSVDATIRDEAALLAEAGVLWRRGPSTGPRYEATADPRFRRAERLRLELPLLADVAPGARLLDRQGQTMALPVTLSERLDEATGTRFIVADLTLAPLAIGEYALEITAEQNGRQERVIQAFRMVP